jgi:hypothetical protein
MTDQSPTLYCANHPNTPTSLRCNNCEKPICPRCAVLTPTGYRCRECLREQQKKFDTAEWYDYILAFIAGMVVSFLGSLLVNFLIRFLGFWIILVFLAIGTSAGFIIAEVIRYVTRRRRSKRLFQLAAASVIVGFLPLFLINLISLNFWGVLWISAYAFTAASTVYGRLRGLKL